MMSCQFDSDTGLMTNLGKVALVIATVLFTMSFILVPSVLGGLTAAFFGLACLSEFWLKRN